MKQTTCCKATYHLMEGRQHTFVCDNCESINMIEDTVVDMESMEYRFRKKFCNENINDSSTPIHYSYMNGGIGRMLSDMEDFIKSELKQRDMEWSKAIFELNEKLYKKNN